MNKCRLRMQQEVSDFMFRGSNMDKDGMKSYLKGQIINALGEEASKKVDVLVDMTRPETYKIQSEVWMFTREDLLELLTSSVNTLAELRMKLWKEKEEEAEKLRTKELIKYEEL